MPRKSTPKKSPKSEPISIRLTVEVREALGKAAVDAGTTVSAWAAQAIADAVSGRAPVMAATAHASPSRRRSTCSIRRRGRSCTASASTSTRWRTR